MLKRIFHCAFKRPSVADMLNEEIETLQRERIRAISRAVAAGNQVEYYDNLISTLNTVRKELGAAVTEVTE
jgi:hypothetical protein